MRVRPLTPAALVEALADRIVAGPAGRFLRVALDGPPAAGPAELADALVDPLRLRGRPAVRVSAGDFLRARSLRLERGRDDPDAYYEDWLDDGALRREVLDPLGPAGSGWYLPALWNAALDRATRAAYVQAPPGAVALVDGGLLLGRGLPFDLTVHLALSASALERRTPTDQRWTLPAYGRYAAEVGPQELADAAVRLDDPRRPALVE